MDLTLNIQYQDLLDRVGKLEQKLNFPDHFENAELKKEIASLNRMLEASKRNEDFYIRKIKELQVYIQEWVTFDDGK